MADLSHTPAPRTAFGGVVALPRPIASKGPLAQALAAWRQRRQLERLDTRMLRDIGLTERDVRLEINRSPWDAPHHWRL